MIITVLKIIFTMDTFIEITMFLSLYVAATFTLGLIFLTLLCIACETDLNLDTNNWWIEIENPCYSLGEFLPLLLSPSVILFWWLYNQQISNWWYLTLLVTVFASYFIWKIVVQISILILLAIIRGIIACVNYIPEILQKVKRRKYKY